MGGRQGAPNQVLQKTSHAINRSSGLSAAPRVVRLLTLAFWRLTLIPTT
jgi:hypothetical protein